LKSEHHPSDPSSSQPQSELDDTDDASAGPVRTGWLIQYEPWLRWLARREIDSRFHGKFSASDAVQQTIIEAWKGWDEFRGEEEPQRRAWLRQILAHQMANLARQYAGTKKRDVSREVAMQQSLAQSAAKLENVLPADVSSPSHRAIRGEQQLQIAGALEQLSEDYRTVIVLRHIDDLSHADIARQMNRSEGAVRMLWVRALAQLRDILSASSR
jgi:RNA polymerase sigma-70 factor (ECF subfamily)